MGTDYLAGAASAYWRLISRPYAYLKVVCRLQTGEMKLAVATLIICAWAERTCVCVFGSTLWKNRTSCSAGIHSNNAQTCWATSRVFSGPSVARQAVWATRGIDLATGFVFSVGVCSSVEPRVTKRPFFFLSSWCLWDYVSLWRPALCNQTPCSYEWPVQRDMADTQSAIKEMVQ